MSGFPAIPKRDPLPAWIVRAARLAAMRALSYGPRVLVPRAATPALLAALFIVGYGAAIAHRPAMALLVPGLLASVILWPSAGIRLLFVVLGGMLVLGSSSSLSPLKVAYLVGAVLAVAVAVVRVLEMRGTAAFLECRRLLALSATFGCFVAAEGFLAVSGGTQLSSAVRDASVYLLFAAVPFLALDVHASGARRWLPALFTALGVMATFSYAAYFLGARGLASLPFGPVTLVAGGLPIALFSYAAAAAIWHPKWFRWTALAIGVLALMLATGNRSALIALVALPTMLMVHPRWRGKPLRALAAGIALALFAGAILLGSGRVAPTNVVTLRERFGSLLHPSNLPSDQSFQWRAQQTHAAAAVWAEHPVLGAGPGHLFRWINPLSGEVHADAFTLDSPLVYPAKFGWVGVILLAALFAAYGQVLRRRVRAAPSVPIIALAGFGAVGVLASLLLGFQIEDKAFSFAILLLLAMSLPDSSGEPKTQDHDRTRPERPALATGPAQACTS